MLSGRGLCDGLITRPEESYRLWCVVCDLPRRNLKNEDALAHWGAAAPWGKKVLLQRPKYSQFYKYITYTCIHTRMYGVQLRKNINPENEKVVTGISEFIGIA